ncbi:MAG TPA: glycoside hydrolase family 3 N-terminal domain-containing protein [Polyangiaceae bacterium]
MSSPWTSRKLRCWPAVLALACTPVAQPAGRAAPSAEERASVPTPDLEALLASMSLDEKIGQMTQADRDALASPKDVTSYALGSVLNGGDSLPKPNTPSSWADMTDELARVALETRLGIPLLYGTDAVHGHAGVHGAVVFPHNIGLGATRNPALVEAVERVTALEVAGSGAEWSFAPCLAVPRDERWGRTYEGFGETPELVALLAPAAVNGFQQAPIRSRSAGPTGVLACAKHFAGDGGTWLGKDRSDTRGSEDELARLHLAGYVAAVRAGVGSIMISFSSWNGMPMHQHRRLVTEYLKGELGFPGFVVTDWRAVDLLPGATYAEKVDRAINAGIDMVMVPYQYKEFIATTRQLVNQGRIASSRIDDAVRRILKQKARFGLWQKPFADRRLTEMIGSDEHRQVARQAVRESLVLLKNERGVLPLAKDVRVNVAGSRADDIGAQCGGWTVGWQGMRGKTTHGTSLLEGLRSVARDPSLVTFSADDPARAEPAAAVNVIVLGEEPYAEYKGDRTVLELPKSDVELLGTLEKSGKPSVLVLLTGRPLPASEAFALADAVVVAWLPGSEGAGVADVLYGDSKPSGKLSHSWPRSMAQVPINHGDRDYDPEYAYGFGLSY